MSSVKLNYKSNVMFFFPYESKLADATLSKVHSMPMTCQLSVIVNQLAETGKHHKVSLFIRTCIFSNPWNAVS